MSTATLLLLLAHLMLATSCASEPGLPAGPAGPAQPTDQFSVTGRLDPNPIQADATAVYFGAYPALRWFVIQGETTIGRNGTFSLDLPFMAQIGWEPSPGYFGSVDHEHALQEACRDDPRDAFYLLGYGFDIIANSQGGLITDGTSFDAFTEACRAYPQQCGFVVRSDGVPPVTVADDAYLWFPSLGDGDAVLNDAAFSQPFSLVLLRYAPREIVFRSTCFRSGFDVDLRSGWNTIVLEWDANRLLVRSAHPTPQHVWQFVAFPGAIFY